MSVYQVLLRNYLDQHEHTVQGYCVHVLEFGLQNLTANVQHLEDEQSLVPATSEDRQICT